MNKLLTIAMMLAVVQVCMASLPAAGRPLAGAPEQTDSTGSGKAGGLDEGKARNVHYNILGGPGYTPDFGLVIGASALVTFRINPDDTLQKRSVVPLNIGVQTKGGVNVMIKPQLFFRGDRFRVFGQFSLVNLKENYYGVGYATNRHYERSDTTSEYRHFGVQANPRFMFRLGEGNFFVGPQIDVCYDRMSSPARHLVTQPDYLRLGGKADGYDELNTGVGFLLTYDSRDVPANAYKGVYLDFRGMIYRKFMGGDYNFSRLEIDYRQYLSVGRRKVLAWTVQSKNVFGDVPLMQYSLLGTPFDLRGYYKGQYRDRSSHLAIAEYRQMINCGQDTRLKRLLGRVGFVAWGGVGFMGPTVGKIEGVLPNAGVGLRIEVQPRMNVRLDFGRNFANGKNLFYFNMTEAF